MAYRDLVKPDRQQHATVAGCSVARDGELAQAWLALRTAHSGELVYGPSNPLLRGADDHDGVILPTRERLPPPILPCVQVDREQLATLGPDTPVEHFDKRGRKLLLRAPLGELGATAAIVIAGGQVETLQVWVPPVDGRALDGNGRPSLGGDTCLGCRGRVVRGAEWTTAAAPVIVPWVSKGGAWAFSFLVPFALAADVLLGPWQGVLLEELRKHRSF
jgi:hypothetical protein